MLPRRKTQGLNLAFIDIMSCGLGAIILVFILVKPGVAVTPADETKKLREDLESAVTQEKKVSSDIEAARAKIAATEKNIQFIQSEVTRLQDELSKNNQGIVLQESRISAVKKSITARPIKKTDDIISNENKGEEEYLLGLKVEGSRIGLLIDASSSMTDERLIDIIKTKAKPDAIKRVAPKWKRTKKIASWLLSRLPASSKVSVATFNSNSALLGGAAWHDAGSAAAISSVLRDLDKTIPTGATNLYKGLMRMQSLSPALTHLYVITDGLPTKGESNFPALNPFSSCFSLLGKANTISGECRARLFLQTVKDAAPDHRVPVNVILLPLEGDPQAAPYYWRWTAATGGLLISPAQDWP